MKTEFETYRQIGNWEIGKLEQLEPSCFNGMVRFRKTKITIEPIEEDKEVLAERLQKLWDESDNHHDSVPLEIAARSIGYELKGSRGNKRK